MDIDQRLDNIERTIERHSDRLATIEGKLANDYKSIMTLLDDVKNLREQNALTMRKVETLEEKVDTFIQKLDKLTEDQKARDASLSKTMKSLRNWMMVALVLSSAAIIYSTIQNGTTASAITTLVGILTKVGML
jgi:chromosome segregation ATPase